MPHLKPKVFISPGVSGFPDTPKLRLLSQVAKTKGLQVEVLDCTQIQDPEVRVERLLKAGVLDCKHSILVGSSMGGYVSAVAAETHEVDGLFLLSPVLYLPPYKNLDPCPQAKFISIVHGLQDNIVPPENVRRFARKFSGDLHLLQSDHSLDEHLPEIRVLFGQFLDRCLQANNPAEQGSGGNSDALRASP